MRRSVFCLLMLSVMISGPVLALDEDDFPRRISVLPLFFVSRGQRPPTSMQLFKLQRHVKLTQRRYREMLSGRDTFEIVGKRPRIVHYNSTLATLKKKVEKHQLSAYLLSQLFREFKVNRFNCPYVFVVVVMNPREAWPTASGRPINLGFNSGGGIATFSSIKLDAKKSLFQGSLLHELGHALGLLHVDYYGYDQRANKSIMSYSKSNWWTNYTPPKDPSILIPEDIRALAMNKRVFPNLYFDIEHDVPEGYRLHGNIIRFSFEPTIPGQKPYEIKLSTTSGEEGGTKAGNVVRTWVKPNRKAKKGDGLIAKYMWMSGKKDDELIDLDIEFPIAVRMNRICVQSQCGGGYHPITAIRVEANTGDYVELAGKQEPLTDEEYITFKETKAKQWRLHFLPGESKQIVLRGLRFYSSQGEFFCQMYPTHLMIEKKGASGDK
ncbi:MAG: zinc metalloprotease [Planctomycetota bacterium]